MWQYFIMFTPSLTYQWLLSYLLIYKQIAFSYVQLLYGSTVPNNLRIHVLAQDGGDKISNSGLRKKQLYYK